MGPTEIKTTTILNIETLNAIGARLFERADQIQQVTRRTSAAGPLC